MKYPIGIKRKTVKQVTKLNLSGRGLKEFPENVFEYTNLTKLVLSNNHIKVVPKEILRLKKLKVLDLANNEIPVLQSAVFNLPKLRTLNVYGNKIKKFPKQVYGSKIQKFIIGRNPIAPEEIAKLENFCEVVHTSIEEVDVQLPEVLGKVSREEIVNTNDDNKMEKKHSIFISYSHEDKEWLTKVLKYLKPLLRFYNNLEVWSDEKIKASDVWKEEIDNALSQATIAILIVSQDFVSSDFITNEELQPLLEKAQKEGTRIMPLIVRPCAFFDEYGLSKYQAVNDPKLPLLGMSGYDQERKLVEMVNVIKEIIKR